jgi:hypothetical protein
VIADQINVAGSPATQWLGTELLSGVSADVEQEKMVLGASKRAPDLQAVPVQIGAVQELNIANALATRCAEMKPLVETPSARLANARSVWVARSRGSTIPFDVIKSWLENWGRFTLVEKPDQADLLIQVATTGGDSDVRVTSSTEPSFESGKPERSTHTSKDLSSSEVTVTVFDARNRRVLWIGTETAKFSMKQTGRENNLVEAAEKLAAKFHDRLEPRPKN